MLMFGAQTTGIAVAHSAIASLPSTSNPVVPTTAAMRARAHREMRQRSGGTREIDPAIARFGDSVDVGDTPHAGRAAELCARIEAEHRAAGDIERTGERQIGGG
jgi:hypothetical protein